MNKIFLPVLIVAAGLAVFNCTSKTAEKPEDIRSVPVVETDSTHSAMTLHLVDPVTDEHHRLLVHTISLNDSLLAGYSLNTEAMEEFLLSPADHQYFEGMKRLKGITSREVHCVDCHTEDNDRYYLKTDPD